MRNYLKNMTLGIAGAGLLYFAGCAKDSNPVAPKTNITLEDTCNNAYDTLNFASYPKQFIENGGFNAKIILGRNGTSTESMSITNILAGILGYGCCNTSIQSCSTVFDDQISSLYNQNTIIVGTVCDNAMARQFTGLDSCIAEMQPGMGEMRLKRFGNFTALYVTGGSDDDIINASRALNDISASGLSGSEIYVNSTPIDTLSTGTQ